MSKIKHTKTELKAQRDALRRFERFLPMLQLKKQQLQVELQTIDAQLAAKRDEEAGLLAGLDDWVALWSEPVGLENIVTIGEVHVSEGNIAGVAIPVFERVDIDVAPYDLHDTPTWVDDAVELAAGLARVRIERETLEEQYRLIAEELRVTSQRVNLFEKVKIPECRENIRIIKIFLGDEQTASVARGKIAKKRSAA